MKVIHHEHHRGLQGQPCEQLTDCVVQPRGLSLDRNRQRLPDVGHDLTDRRREARDDGRIRAEHGRTPCRPGSAGPTP